LVPPHSASSILAEAAASQPAGIEVVKQAPKVPSTYFRRASGCEEPDHPHGAALPRQTMPMGGIERLRRVDSQVWFAAKPW
jgi:hypothetical protein